jgi:hypothetical protein
MSEVLYQVIFDATITGEFSLETTRSRFQKLFGLEEPTLNKLFSGKDLVIKKHLCEDDATQFSIKIAEAGCESVIESMPGSGEEGGENRISGDRRTQFRRDPRPGALVGERTQSIRRGSDTAYFEELILNQADIPIGFNSYTRAAFAYN